MKTSRIPENLLFFAYKVKGKKAYRGVCLPFFVTIERDTLRAAKEGLEKRVRAFVGMLEKHEYDERLMYQEPDYDEDIEYAQALLDMLTIKLKERHLYLSYDQKTKKVSRNVKFPYFSKTETSAVVDNLTACA